MLSSARLEELLARIPSVRLAVVGDFFLDKYLIIDPDLAEVSLETGLEARQVVQIRCSPGAAGTVTNTLSTLGNGVIQAIGVTGDDGQRYELEAGLCATRVDTAMLRMDTARFTPTYTKPMVRREDGETELERIDIKNRAPLSSEAEDRVLADLKSAIEAGATGVIAADQVQERNCGVISDRVRAGIEALAAANPGIVFFADSRCRIDEFRGITIKPNSREASVAAFGDPSGEGDLEKAGEAGRRLADRNGRTVFVTVGPAGILVCTPGGTAHVPAIPVTGPIDIVGAGDSVTAGIVSALCAGATEVEAAAFGALCSSVTIRKLGTTGTASPDELRDALTRAVW